LSRAKVLVVHIEISVVFCEDLFLFETTSFPHFAEAASGNDNNDENQWAENDRNYETTQFKLFFGDRLVRAA
jgi:hypothetical protein